jgi:cell wall-associated NlpC family hydrolase
MPVAIGVAQAKNGTAPNGSGGNSAGTPVTGGVSVAGAPAPKSTSLHPMVLGTAARIIHGVAYAPSSAPIQVQRAIWAGDRIRHKPYLYAGGHGRWNDVGYDCSGTVSYVLHAAGLLPVSMDSSQFMSWGKRGLGSWMTIYTNPGHAFIEIAGIRLDTSNAGDPNPFPPGTGPRWRPLLSGTSGFVARHPAGL